MDFALKSCSGGDRRCTTKYCTRTAYRTETKYKNVPVYETWYSWKVWRWVPNRTVTKSGDDCHTRWPSDDKIALNKSCGEGEKERANRVSIYEVTFEDADKDKHTYKPRDQAEFESLPKGTHKTLKVSLVGDPEIVADKK